ncbi:MAG: hypothetical protein CVU89_09780 [Firmicutes bacterium HGW-Firmicutes-14]|nr:MAG: hypothetical protein CVU89_09780 [Firmicutes bacterium HGW-Firmicutes-14]
MVNFIKSIKKLFGAADSGSEEDKGGRAARPVWKKLNNLIIIAAAGIFLIILANVFSSDGNPPDGLGGGGTPEIKSPGIVSPGPEGSGSGEDKGTGVAYTPGITELENLLAERLEKALVQISGAGKLEVTVNLASTLEKDCAVNTVTNKKTTEEHDQKGGNRTITELNENGQMVLIRESQGSTEQPVVVREVKPEVKGVIVVAEGAHDPAVKADLMNAVQVYLDVPLYKVIVLPRESR